MSCDDVAAAIVDEGLPRPPEFRAHLEQCPRCRELVRLHASASNLRLPENSAPLVPISEQSIRGEVHRRHRRRRTVAGVAVAGAIAAVALLITPQKTAPPQQEMAEPSVEVAELPPIDQLVEEVEGYTQRDLTFDDETYAPFGALALWVRPSSPTALNERPFRKALAPLHPSPTLEPSR